MSDSNLIFAGNVIGSGARLRVCTAEGEVEACAPAALLAKLVTVVDGSRNRDAIVAAMARWDAAQLRALLDSLVEQRALVPVSAWPEQTWTHIAQPWSRGEVPPGADEIQRRTRALHESMRVRAGATAGAVPPAGSVLQSLIARRCSEYAFEWSPVGMSDLASVLCASYGILADAERLRRTVPAGGALYSLSLHVLVRVPSKELPVGVYRANFARGGVSLVRAGTQLARFPRAFHAFASVRHAPVVVCISADFGIPCFKYGERGLMYAVLEAGHAAQNALLSATDLGLASVEVGGFSDAELKTLLRLPSGTTPVTTIALGHRAQPASEDRARISLQTRWIELPESRYQPGFHLAMVQGGKKGWAWGRDASAEVAFDKAVSEMWERMACAHLGDTREGRSKDFDDVLTPERVAAFDGRQFSRAGFPVKPFAPAAKRKWARAVRSDTGGEQWLPAELVYFRSAFEPSYGARACAFANSSGVAAATDEALAKERALLELIERDAFMTHWLARRTAPHVPKRRLPASVRRRVEALERLGLLVVLADITLDLAPVVAAWVQSEAGTYTTVGACAHFDLTAAADHALAEAESQVHLMEAGLRPPPRDARNIDHAWDHGEIYMQSAYFRRADWQFKASGSRWIPAARRLPTSLDELLNLLHRRGLYAAFAALPNPRGAPQDLSIVRAVVPGLVPMTFGYDTEPWGNVRSLYRDDRLVSRQSFARPRSYFPHPFS